MNMLIERMANLIIANLHNTSVLGLFNGKMGIALFLYRYAKFSGKEFYEKFADDLIDEIYDEINKSMPPDLSRGLSGIGVGLTYLLQEEYLEGDADEILSEIDELLLEEPLNTLKQDVLLPHPAYSAGIYLLSRVSEPITVQKKRWIENVVRSGYAFMEEMKKKENDHLPLSFLNSMLFVYSSLYDKKVEGFENFTSFIHCLFELALDAIDNEKYEYIDLLIFKEVSMKLPDRKQDNGLHERMDYLLMNIPNDIEWRDDLLWWQFIYNLHLQTNPLEEEIMKYVNDKIRDYPFELSVLNGQIASLGFSACFYKSWGKGVKRISNAKTTDILYVSTSVTGMGGAYSAAQRIYLGLRGIELSSKMLVLDSGMSKEENLHNEIFIAHRREGELCGYDNDMRPLKDYPYYSVSSHGFSTAMVGVDLAGNIERFNPNLVMLQGINGGFATIENMGRIKRKIVWTLPDCWAFTGGCYYNGNCTRYQTGCGKCPKLGSDDDNDLSHQIWKRKEKAWDNMDMTIVVPTDWMRKIVQRSTLLKDKEVYVIANGMDLKSHYPVDKSVARRALNIPADKKVILFGAVNAFDPRKGFVYLIESLKLLSDKHKDEYCLVVFGMGNQELQLDIPVNFLGYLHDSYLLQLAYSSADVMVVPSVEEAFGQTVTEAMACATPVVSFEETGPADIIEHLKTGYLARYLDEKDLAQGIEWILDSKERMNELSYNARKRVEISYDIKIIAKEYEELYHCLLKN